jgi:hypothetical protein
MLIYPTQVCEEGAKPVPARVSANDRIRTKIDAAMNDVLSLSTGHVR